jgi:hypothetical protein
LDRRITGAGVTGREPPASFQSASELLAWSDRARRQTYCGAIYLSKEDNVATRDVTNPRANAGTSGRPGFIQRLGTETKAAFKTTEFYVMIAVLVGILIAGNTIEIAEGGTDYFAADKVWLYITVLTVGYMLSRGIAKSGVRDPYWDERGDRNADH